MRILKTLCLGVGLTILLAACASSTPTATSVPTSLSSTSVPLTQAAVPSTQAVPTQTAPVQGTADAVAVQQVAAGQQVYTQHCAQCHGANLQGMSGPPLTQSYVASFGQASGLVDYISKQMPLNAPGSLSQEQYYDVLAYILDQDGLLPAGTPLTPQNVGTLSLTAPQAATPTGLAVSTATPGPQQQVVVQAAQIPPLGSILVNSDGFSLYYNSEDGPDHSTCTDSCAYAWPPLAVPEGAQPLAPPGIPGKLGVFQRPDGSNQVTYTDLPNYDKVPLYTYFDDIEPGDRNGNLLQGIWSNIVLTAGVAATTTATVTPGQGVAAQGVADYLLNCSPCHGIQGQGVDAPPLRNSQYIQTAGDQTIAQVIVEGIPNSEMPAWLLSNGGSLTAAQIQNIVAYLHTLQGVSPVPPATPPPPEPTETPLPPGAPTPEPARPSMPGGPGAAATITGNVAQGRPMFGLYCATCHGPEGVQGIANPDSDDEAIPPLNPIDPTIANPDSTIFAYNVDLFIENGSIPEGEGPLLLMPPFGARNMLSQQQIADLIAYVMSLNGVTFSAAPGPSPTATPSTASMPTPSTQVTAGTMQQVAVGQQVYTQQCAACHGANLQGVRGPALDQPSIAFLGNAKKLLDLISQQMPLTAPGSLSEQEYDDVTAFILDKDGLLPSGTTLTSQNAGSISLSAPATPTPTPAADSRPLRLHHLFGLGVPGLVCRSLPDGSLFATDLGNRKGAGSITICRWRGTVTGMVVPCRDL
jgi:mono/diheme cytochrome c family protein